MIVDDYERFSNYFGHLVMFVLVFKDASVAEKEDVFGLDGQIEHKLAFLRKHVPRETTLLLIGHSIGCYIILDMMKRDPELKVFQCKSEFSKQIYFRFKNALF